MGLGTCDPASRGEAFNQVVIQNGPILADCHYGWDGASVKPNCDGPVISLRVQNTGTVAWYANLPNKKSGNRWVQISPGTDQTFTAAQCQSIGLTNYSDVAGVGLSPTPGP